MNLDWTWSVMDMFYTQDPTKYDLYPPLYKESNHTNSDKSCWFLGNTTYLTNADMTAHLNITKFEWNAFEPVSRNIRSNSNFA